jgi:PKD repeat protein
MFKKSYIHSLLLIYLTVLSIHNSFSQEHTIHTGEHFVVRQGTQLYIIGSLTDSINSNTSLNLPITNLGEIYIGGNLHNEGTKNVFGNINQNQGKVIFNGTADRFINGNDSIHFHNLLINIGSSNGLSTEAYLIINDSLHLFAGRLVLLDSISLYHSSIGSDGNSGIIDEDNTNRIHGTQTIRVDNFNWNINGIYTAQDLKNIGISFEVLDYLGASAPIIRRDNINQDCGPSQNSVERTYSFLEINNTGEIQNVSAKFHDNNELGSNGDGTLMHIYRSNNDGDSWEDIGGTSGFGVVNNSSFVHNISNYSMYTLAKDTCDVLPILQINQIITNTTPNDTLYNITNAMACDLINPDAILLPTGDPGIYTWTYPDMSTQVGIQNVSISPGILGQFILTIQDIRGCVNHDTVTIIQAPAANADFNINAAGYCANVSAPFSPTAANLPGYTYEWDFGDGTTGVGYSVSHTYTSDGTYQVNLTVTSDLGCIDGNVENIVIHPIPVAAFTYTPACPNTPLFFENNSLANPTQPVNLSWDVFNDLTIDLTSAGVGNGNGGNTSYTFPNAGTFSVTLTASSNGCTSLPVTQSVLVHPLPSVNFSYSNACEGQSVNFTNLTSITDASALSYSWNFNGSVGPISTLTNPSFPYATDGTYLVTLTATSANGCVSSFASNVTVDENPVVSFNASGAYACVNNVSSFGGNSTVPGAIWNWNFGDGNNGTGQNTTHTYTNDGSFLTTLTVTTAQGCVGSSSNNVIIYPGPTIGYSVLDGCQGSPRIFQNTTTNAISYLWNFPSLNYTSTSTQENQTFNTPGYHIVELTATSSNNCSSTFIDSVNIFPLPIINLGGATIATCGASYILDANVTNTTGNSYFWTTGATTAQLNATYNGNFGVTVTSGNGCQSSASTNLTLNSVVLPNLGVNRTVCDQETLNAGYTGASYSWNTGATTQTIDVVSTGTYSVTVTDQNGCIGTNSVVITVTTSNPLSLGANQQTACQGEIIVLNANNTGNTFLWSTGATTQTINVSLPGYYSVEVTNAAGCVSTDTVETVFFAAPLVSLGSDGEYCVENTYNVFTSNASYLWNNGTTNADLTVSNSGIYWVDVTNLTTSCTTRDSVSVIINPLPSVNLGNDTTLCSYESITLNAGNTGANYLWNNGSLSQTTTVFATGLYSVVVTDANGCVNDDQINVTLNPLFTFDLGPDRPFCNGSTILLDPQVGNNGSSFNWYTNNGTLSSAATFNVPDTGTYFVEIVDLFGCEAIDSITIIPSNLSLTALYLADSKVLIGDSILFINLSFPKPYTSLWDFDNGVTSTDSVPTYTYFIPGDYDVKLTVNNGNCVSELTKTITVDPVKISEPENQGPVDLYSSIIDMNLYPNPNNGQFTLKLTLENEAIVELDIFNILGQRIYAEKFVTEKSERTYQLDGIQPGMYVVRARVGKEMRTIKFIKI